MAPSRLATRSPAPGGCIDEVRLAEHAALGGSGVLGEPERLGVCHAGSGALGAGGGRLRKGKELHVSALEQSTRTARFHLGMGGRGGAPRVALFVLLG